MIIRRYGVCAPYVARVRQEAEDISFESANLAGAYLERQYGAQYDSPRQRP